MEHIESIWTILKVHSWIPFRVFVMANPLGAVFQFVISLLYGDKVFDFLLVLVIDPYRRRWLVDLSWQRILRV